MSSDAPAAGGSPGPGPPATSRLASRLASLLRPRRWPLGQLFLGVVAVASLAVLYGPFLAQCVANARDDLLFNDDVREQIYPFDHERDPALFPDDYLARYNLACMAPGYRLLYAGLAHVADPRTVSKALPLVLLAVVLGALAVGALKFGRVAAAWVVVALGLSSGVFLDRMVGGLPRAFGFPILACAAAALIHGRMLAVAVITVAGAAFYPAAALPAGMALSLALLGLPAKDRGTAATWSLKRRLVTLALTVAAAAAVLAPTSLAVRAYGGYIQEGDLEAYPEGGPGGRFYAGDRPPYTPMIPLIAYTEQQTLSGGGTALTPLLDDPTKVDKDRQWHRALAAYGFAWLAFLGCLRRALSDGTARRILLLLVAAVGGHLLAKLVAPYLYLPPRYLVFPIPVLLLLMLPLAAHGLFAGMRRLDRPLVRDATVFAVGLACLLLLGGRGDASTGYTIRIDPRSGIYPFLASLPKDAMIAGWPSGVVMDSVPYVTRRQAFLTFETHQAFQKGYVEHLRGRMRAFLDAYLGRDPKALVTLRDRFGVTHLVADVRDFQRPPSYFKPFDAWIKETYAKNAGYFAVPRLFKTAGVYTEGPLTVLDLSRVPGKATREPDRAGD